MLIQSKVKERPINPLFVLGSDFGGHSSQSWVPLLTLEYPLSSNTLSRIRQLSHVSNLASSSQSHSFMTRANIFWMSVVKKYGLIILLSVYFSPGRETDTVIWAGRLCYINYKLHNQFCSLIAM